MKRPLRRLANSSIPGKGKDGFVGIPRTRVVDTLMFLTYNNVICKFPGYPVSHHRPNAAMDVHANLLLRATRDGFLAGVVVTAGSARFGLRCHVGVPHGVRSRTPLGAAGRSAQQR
jgi:hypothetical protein